MAKFTELRTMDQEASFSSVGLSTSVCSLSLLEGLEVTAADGGLCLLADTDQLGQDGQDSGETADTKGVPESSWLERADKTTRASYAEQTSVADTI